MDADAAAKAEEGVNYLSLSLGGGKHVLDVCFSVSVACQVRVKYKQCLPCRGSLWYRRFHGSIPHHQRKKGGTLLH